MAVGQLIDTRPARFMTWFALIFALATDAAYLLLILRQGGAQPDIVTVGFVASYLVLLAPPLAASLSRRWTAGRRLSLRAGGTIRLPALGDRASFSLRL